ncbi:MAG: hypothetical protein ACKO63_02515 [Nodosilinea sp.]
MCSPAISVVGAKSVCTALRSRVAGVRSQVVTCWGVLLGLAVEAGVGRVARAPDY